MRSDMQAPRSGRITSLISLKLRIPIRKLVEKKNYFGLLLRRIVISVPKFIRTCW